MFPNLHCERVALEKRLNRPFSRVWLSGALRFMRTNDADLAQLTKRPFLHPIGLTEVHAENQTRPMRLDRKQEDKMGQAMNSEGMCGAAIVHTAGSKYDFLG